MIVYEDLVVALILDEREESAAVNEEVALFAANDAAVGVVLVLH